MQRYAVARDVGTVCGPWVWTHVRGSALHHVYTIGADAGIRGLDVGRRAKVNELRARGVDPPRFG